MKEKVYNLISNPKFAKGSVIITGLIFLNGLYAYAEGVGFVNGCKACRKVVMDTIKEAKATLETQSES